MVSRDFGCSVPREVSSQTPLTRTARLDINFGIRLMMWLWFGQFLANGFDCFFLHVSRCKVRILFGTLLCPMFKAKPKVGCVAFSLICKTDVQRTEVKRLNLYFWRHVSHGVKLGLSWQLLLSLNVGSVFDRILTYF